MVNISRLLLFLLCLAPLLLSGCTGFLPFLNPDDPDSSASAAEEPFPNQKFTAYTNSITCKKFIESSQTPAGNSDAQLLVGAFMTGSNYQQKRVSDVKLVVLLETVKNICRVKPGQSVTLALISLDRAISEKVPTRDDDLPTFDDEGNEIQTTPSEKTLSVNELQQRVAPLPAKEQQQRVAPLPAKEQQQRVAPSMNLPVSVVDGKYVVQVSSTQDKNEAVRKSSQLQALHFPVYLQSVDLGERGVWQRVLVGPYADHADAAKVAALLQPYENDAFVRVLDKK